MISNVLLAALIAAPAAPASPAANPTQARKALASCLNSALMTDLDAKTQPAAFKTKLSSICANEKAAYTTASIAADVGVGIKREAAERNASTDLDDIVSSAADRYQLFFESGGKPH